MKKSQTTKSSKNVKNFYAFGTYKPNKNAVQVVYNGTTYLSKAQCMALEGITRKELDAYLNAQEETVIPTPEEVAIEETFDEHTEELIQDILADREETSLDSLLND